MSFEVLSIPSFDRKAKKLVKKFPSLKQELEQLKTMLSDNPATGIPLGRNCYKIRLSIESKGTAKSGGARIITHVQITDTIVYLLYIFDKSEQDNISDKDLLGLINAID